MQFIFFKLTFDFLDLITQPRFKVLDVAQPLTKISNSYFWINSF